MEVMTPQGREVVKVLGEVLHLRLENGGGHPTNKN